TGQLGEVTLVTSRAFMNRLVALDNYQRTNDPTRISPMVISGTHALDIVMWMMDAKRPVEIYARSVDKALAPICKGTDPPPRNHPVRGRKLVPRIHTLGPADRLPRRGV